MAGEYIMNLYGRLEQEVINDIARRVAKTGRYTETAEIQARALREQGFSPAKIQSEVMKSLNADNAYLNEVAINTKEYKAKVVELIEETVAQAIIDGDALIAEAGLMSFNDDLQMWQEHGADLTKDNTLDQLNKAFTKQTMGELENLTRSTGALDVGGVPILNAYRHEMDLATVKVASGAFSFQQAMEDCCHRLGKNGVAVTYPSGRKYSLESATRMCMKTGLSQLSGKITEANMDKTSTSLVYVSAHAGARPEHAEWQGKVYTYQGKPSKKYPDFVESTGYGTVTGLKGVNCSHEFYPWWEGDEIPEFHEPDPVEIDGRTYTYYEATQKQRQMERSVRNMSREQQAALAAGDNQKATELNAKIKATKQDYKAFSQAAGLRAKTERMRVFDTEEKTAATAKAPAKKSTVAEKRKREIIKEAIEKPIPIYDDALAAAYISNGHQPVPGVFDFGCHGDNEMTYYNGNEKMDVEMVYKILMGRKDYKKGTPVRLLSCSTGEEDENGDCFAQYLADKLNAIVYAPEGLLTYDKYGIMEVEISDYVIRGRGLEAFKEMRPIYGRGTN